MQPYGAILGVLKAKSIYFEELEHEPVFTSEQAARVRGLAIDAGAKSLLLKANGKYVLVVMPGSKKLDSKKLKLILGTKRLRFAAPEEVKEIMHCEIGACYPFGSLIGLDTYMDSSLKNQSKISFNPGLHHKSIT